MSKNSSTNSGKHPYMRPEKFHRFWEGSGLYSQETKDRLNNWWWDELKKTKKPMLNDLI